MRYFKGKQFKKDIILVAVGYYCRFSLNYRDVSELLKERGISVHPTTIMRWVHEYGNLIYQIWKKKNKSEPFLHPQLLFKLLDITNLVWVGVLLTPYGVIKRVKLNDMKSI